MITASRGYDYVIRGLTNTLRAFAATKGKAFAQLHVIHKSARRSARRLVNRCTGQFGHTGQWEGDRPPPQGPLPPLLVYSLVYDTMREWQHENETNRPEPKPPPNFPRAHSIQISCSFSLSFSFFLSLSLSLFLLRHVSSISTDLPSH